MDVLFLLQDPVLCGRPYHITVTNSSIDCQLQGQRLGLCHQHSAQYRAHSRHFVYLLKDWGIEIDEFRIILTRASVLSSELLAGFLRGWWEKRM